MARRSLTRTRTGPGRRGPAASRRGGTRRCGLLRRASASADGRALAWKGSPAHPPRRLAAERRRGVPGRRRRGRGSRARAPSSVRSSSQPVSLRPWSMTSSDRGRARRGCRAARGRRRSSVPVVPQSGGLGDMAGRARRRRLAVGGCGSQVRVHQAVSSCWLVRAARWAASGRRRVGNAGRTRRRSVHHARVRMCAGGSVPWISSAPPAASAGPRGAGRAADASWRYWVESGPIVPRPARRVDLDVAEDLGQVAERDRVGLPAVEDLGEVVRDDRVGVAPVGLLDLGERLPDRHEQHAEPGERRRVLGKRPQRGVAGLVDRR